MKKYYAGQYASEPEIAKVASEILDRKGTLLTRPMEMLLEIPICYQVGSVLTASLRHSKGRLVWQCNPLVVLEETYEFLHMNWRPEAPAAEVIWDHDKELLDGALAFYSEMRRTFGLQKGRLQNLMTSSPKRNHREDMMPKPGGKFSRPQWL